LFLYIYEGQAKQKQIKLINIKKLQKAEREQGNFLEFTERDQGKKLRDRVREIF